MNAPDEIAELLIHLARAARAEDGAAVLTPAQWTALRYLARANDASRTPSGFASFHATTRGTATQTLKTLELRGLIARGVGRRDGRSVCYDLTAEGQTMLARDPLRDLSGAIGDLPASLQAALSGALPQLVAGLATRRAAPQFGTCRDCRHFEDAPASAYCACMAEGLAAAALDRLCINFGMR